jgi:hypothetical protein
VDEAEGVAGAVAEREATGPSRLVAAIVDRSPACAVEPQSARHRIGYSL